MTVTAALPQQTSIITWHFEFSSSLGADTVISVYQFDRLVGTTTRGEWDITVTDSRQPTMQFIDSEDTLLYAPTGTALLSWNAGDPTVAYYTVEQFIDAAWVERQRVQGVLGQSYFEWESPLLDDVTEHSFRVTPVGINGATGDSQEYRLKMVRLPDIPRATFVYDSGTGKVTIDEAA